jgi:Flp pilus assembly protein TadG
MFRRLHGDQRGAISILAALTMVGVIGFAALAVEYGHGLQQREENQRIADLAAYGAALVYNSSGSTSNATSAANNIVTLNGLPSGDAATALVTSPSGNGNQAMQVTISTAVPLLLSRVVSSRATLPVSATAYAEMKASAPGCIIALSSSGTGISLSGTGSITAPDCAVASNSTVCANGGANPSDVITTKVIDYNSGASPASSSCTLTPPAGTASVRISKTSTADPLAGNSAVSTATARITTVAALTSPSGPSVSGGSNVTFKSTSITGSLPAGCSGTVASSNWTVTCTGTGPFNFNTLAVNGGVSATINNTSSGATYNFTNVIDSGTSNGLTINGGSNATYNMAGGVYAHGSAPLSFGAGTFNVGTTSCGGTAGYSVCVSGSGRITFAGPSTFVLAGGISQGASGMPPSPALSLGYGASTNSFNIGKSSNGFSLNNSNGATLLGDATGGLFQMAGNIATTGGTCVALGATSQHDINGYLAAAGGVVLGSGIYTINAYVAFGNSGGGDVSSCPASGTTTGLTALEVSLVVSGASTISCNGVASSAFCFGAGYSTVKLTAPTSSSTFGSSMASLAVIGPQSSSNHAVAAFTTGATDTRVSGAFYFPNGEVRMTGAASLHDTVDVNACLQLIGSQVTLSAGTATGSSCAGLGGSGGSGVTVALVQ